MSTTTADKIRSVPPWVDRVADWCNPILIKEVRQSLKSRQFVVTFFLLVAGAWLTAVFGLLMFLSSMVSADEILHFGDFSLLFAVCSTLNFQSFQF